MKKGCKICLTIFCCVCVLLIAAGVVIAVVYTPKKPEITLGETEVRNFTVFDANTLTPRAAMDVDFIVNIDNPNAVGVTISGMKFDVFYLEGDTETFMGKIDIQEDNKIKANAITTLKIPFVFKPKHADYPTLLEAWAIAYLAEEPIDCRLDGNVTLSALFVDYDLDIDQEVEVYFTT